MGVDAMLEPIEGFSFSRGGGVIVRKVACGYTLLSERTGAPIVRFRPTGDGDKVKVLWWNGESWGRQAPLASPPCPSTLAKVQVSFITPSHDPVCSRLSIEHHRRADEGVPPRLRPNRLHFDPLQAPEAARSLGGQSVTAKNRH